MATTLAGAMLVMLSFLWGCEPADREGTDDLSRSDASPEYEPIGQPASEPIGQPPSEEPGIEPDVMAESKPLDGSEQPQDGSKPMSETPETEFAALDTDGSGELGPQEWSTSVASLEAGFTQADRDGDGLISENEFEALAGPSSDREASERKD